MQRQLSVKTFILFVVVFGLAVTEAKLLYTFTMARHGAVYPPNDLYDGNQTKEFRGRLTPIGLRQHYNLGTYLNRDYLQSQNLSTQTFDPTHVQFFSTSRQRTLNSAQAFIYGFYPLGQGWKIPQEVPADKLSPPYTPLFPENLQKQNQVEFALNKGFQPLPVRPLDDILDNCPDYDFLLLKRIQETSQMISVLEYQQRQTINRMRTLFNLRLDQANVRTLSDLYDTVYADLNLGRPLPATYDSDDHKNLKYIYEFYNTAIFDGNFGRVMATPSLRILRSKLANIVSNSRLRLSFVFGHHSNLLPLLTALNLTSTQCLTERWKGQTVSSLNCASPPAYAANLIVELHGDGNAEYSVRVKYNGEYLNLCESKSTQCPYNDFVSRLQAAQTNFEQQCKIKGQREEFAIVAE